MNNGTGQKKDKERRGNDRTHTKGNAPDRLLEMFFISEIRLLTDT